MPELIPLGELTGSGGGGGPVTSSSITDATTQGKAVLTGDATAGRNALAAASAADVTALDTRVDDLETDVAAIALPTADTLSGATPVGKALLKAATQSAARGEIGAAAASDLAGKANTASPALTGTPTAPTATPGTNTTQIATTAFVLANTGSDIAGTADVPGLDTALNARPTAPPGTTIAYGTSLPSTVVNGQIFVLIQATP